MGKLTDKVAKGVFWVLLEKFGVQAVHFVVTLVLARLLTPDDYGTVALLSIFISIFNLFVDCGLGKALVQKKNATQTDYNSVFYLSLVLAAVLYMVLFFAAPFVAEFYKIPELKVMLRILSLSLVFHSINGVQNVELNRKMLFKLSFKISWARVIASAVTGISLAFAGYGPWVLVYSSLAGGVVGVIARQLVIRWRPTLSYSWASVKELFEYGWKVMATSLLNQLYSNIQGLLIGKLYTRADLAYVNKGRHIPNLLQNTIDASLRRVSFPALARMQDNPEKLRNAMRRMIKCTTFCIFPMMVVLVFLAAPIIELLYGQKWLGCVPYLQIVCFSAVLRPFDTVNMQAILARGRSDLYFKLMVIRRIACLAILASTIRLGILPFFICSTFTIVPLGVIMNAFPNQRYLGYSIRMQLGDVSESFFLALATGACIFATTYIPAPRLVLLFPQIAFGFGIYFGLAYMLRVSPLVEIAKSLYPMAERRFGADFFLCGALRRLVPPMRKEGQSS